MFLSILNIDVSDSSDADMVLTSSFSLDIGAIKRKFLLLGGCFNLFEKVSSFLYMNFTLPLHSQNNEYN